MVDRVQETQLYKCLETRDSEFLEQLDNVIQYAENMLPCINNVFTNYTVHGIKHSINVIEYMYALVTNVELLSDLEITLLIYSALLHDIGMVANDEEIREIKLDHSYLGERKYSKVFEKYGEEKLALQECIRPIHGKRSKDHIEKYMEEKLFLIPKSTIVSFREEVGLICMAHNEDFEWLEKTLTNHTQKGEFNMNSQYIAVLLRTADCLDIDEQRAPLYLYNYLQPNEFSDLEWKQHFVIENYNKIIKNEKTGLKEIVFQGMSKEPSVHRKLLKYFDLMNKELKNAVSLCERSVEDKYLLPLKTDVINKIQTQGFSFSDLRLSLDYNAVTNLLMGEHIYGDKRYGLRELIQNSIDACKTMEESAVQMDEFRYQKYQPFISIVLDKDRKQVIVMDNGSGMSVDILKKYFLNVGVSYYVSDDYLLQGRDYSPIGRYGIGFLACFMLSDKVEVKTVYYKERKMNRISFEKNSEYICLTYEEANKQQGTEIILDYDQCLSVFDNKIDTLVGFVEKNFTDSGIPIAVSVMENGKPQIIGCEVKNIRHIIPNSICLNQYLNDVEAYIDCTYKQINFADCLKKLNGCDSFYYDTENNSLNVDDELELKSCVKNGKIQMMNIPIISEYEEEDFLKAYDVLGDYEEALDNLGSYISVNVWGNEEEIERYAFRVEESSEEIIGRYTLSQFREQFSHSNIVPIETEYVEINVISNGTNLVLPYNESCTVRGRFIWEYVDSCYVKNVLLSGLRSCVPYLADGIVLKGVVINITNKEFVPNVSRNNANTLQKSRLFYAIGKAIHLWIRDNASLSLEEKELLNLFIETKYNDTNCYLK